MDKNVIKLLRQAKRLRRRAIVDSNKFSRKTDRSLQRKLKEIRQYN